MTVPANYGTEYRYKSGTGIQYPTLAIDLRRSFKCMFPLTVPNTIGLLDSWAALSNPYPNACVQCREVVCSGTPLERPPLLHQKSGLSRGVASRQG